MTIASSPTSISETPYFNVSTPPALQTPSEAISLNLQHGDVSWTLSAARDQSLQIESQFAAFELYLAASSVDDKSPDIETSIGLAGSFLGYLSQHESTEIITRTVLDAFDDDFLADEDVHTLSLSLPNASSQANFLGSYFAAVNSVGANGKRSESKLFARARAGQETLFAMCGGQGPSNLTTIKELKDIYSVYGSFLDELLDAASDVLERLASQEHTSDYFRESGFHVSQWIRESQPGPGEDQIFQAPFSFPLIGLLSLAHFCVICKVLGQTPGDVRDVFTGITGHSQGIVIATLISRSTDWGSFYKSTRMAMEILFCIGYECHENSLSFPPVPANAAKQCVASGEGAPSPMLSVLGIHQAAVQALVDETNSLSKENEYIYISLINSPQSFVLAGPPRSLHALSSRIRKIKATDGLDQSKVVFNQRKPVIRHEFLPMSSAFHCPLVAAASPQILERLKHISIPGNDLGIGVYHTSTRQNLRDFGERNLVPSLVTMIVEQQVDWYRVATFPESSTIVNFGPGGRSLLMLANLKGAGVRLISASDLASYKHIGSKADIFTGRQPRAAPHWRDRFQPRLQTDSGSVSIRNRMTRLFGCPPIMVAGMTPTTVSWDLVASIMKAGYHAELALGGYNSAKALESAIINLSKEIPSAASITCNIIYASPKAVAWQIPLIRDLVRRGYPIQGLTIGAGIPSAEAVQEYIETLGLRHICFKPGSVDAIRQVVNIANTYPDFPIGLQWTGGRAGGHHSYEDFHTPMLETYSEIRQCDNIVLIAGSGFGGAEDSYPYLVGDWSRQFGYPNMPYDGILLGSRMMVAKEAHTSPEVKDLIVKVQGVTDSQWHEAYSRPTGGIITVRSEMGQPIHKIATRGVMLWSELDQKFFNISDRVKRLSELQKSRSWIIDRLNRDFQKVWFAMDDDGSALELDAMTYSGVLKRLIHLMYLKHQQRWIDPSYQAFVADFYHRSRERLQGVISEVISNELQDPERRLAQFLESYPAAQDELLHPDDVSYFLSLCRKRGRKPVNFIPTIDEDFETWFKKDSLWQAEDVAALPDQDVQRSCIIHGPVAASFSNTRDEPAKDILNSIHSSWIEKIQVTQVLSSNNGNATSESPLDIRPWDVETFLIEDTAARKCYRFPIVGKLPEVSFFRDILRQNLSGWALDCIQEVTIRQGQYHRPNPLRSVFVPIHGHDLTIEYSCNGKVAALIMHRRTSIQSQLTEVIRVVADARVSHVSATLKAPARNSSKEASLHFSFQHFSHTTLVKLEEDMTGRNKNIKDFYAKLWLAKDELGSQNGLFERYSGVKTTLTPLMIRNFARAIGSNSVLTGNEVVPIDFCIVVAWEALVKPLLSEAIDCDMLQLLHRSNEFRYVEGAKPLRLGDVLTSSSYIQSVRTHQGSKTVEILAEITRDGLPVVYVSSKFFCKGHFGDVGKSMSRVSEPRYEVLVESEVESAILASRTWLEFDESIIVGQRYNFNMTTETSDDEGRGLRLKVNGSISLQAPRGSHIVGRISFEGLNCASNPVVDFLRRHGSQIRDDVEFQTSGLKGDSTWTLLALRANSAYSKASKDTNPIHTSPVIARFAQLNGIVNHGMGTSAIVLRSLEQAIAEGDFSRIRRYSVSFEGLVLPGDKLKVSTQHIGMKSGRMVLAVKVSNDETGEIVLEATAEIEQPVSAYLFTGQGSQERGMGMKLYESSEAARSLWDRADKSLYDLYGFSILDIVRNDPKSLTLHFGGVRGRYLRDNYLALKMDRVQEDGKVVSEPLLKCITPASPCYTFTDNRGLLYSTQFAQPAIAFMEMATAVDLESKGMIQEGASYAGHSLGEYSALGAIARVISTENMARLLFYRGLAMHAAIERDANGGTQFAMMAVNPSRVADVFGQQSLETVVSLITNETGVLLEIVNFNVDGRQYVCAGHLRALWTLSGVLKSLVAAKMVQVPAEADLLALVQQQAKELNYVAEPIELERGSASTPLRGIDVPFHSRCLRNGIPAYRRHLETLILEENIDLDRLAAFVPNVTAKPFSTDRAYVEEAANIMDSNSLREILANWDD